MPYIRATFTTIRGMAKAYAGMPLGKYTQGIGQQVKGTAEELSLIPMDLSLLEFGIKVKEEVKAVLRTIK